MSEISTFGDKKLDDVKNLLDAVNARNVEQGVGRLPRRITFAHEVAYPVECGIVSVIWYEQNAIHNREATCHWLYVAPIFGPPLSKNAACAMKIGRPCLRLLY